MKTWKVVLLCFLSFVIGFGVGQGSENTETTKTNITTEKKASTGNIEVKKEEVKQIVNEEKKEVKGEFFIINNEQAYIDSPNVKVNLWPSYEDRSQVLGQPLRYEPVVLISRDEKNNYCNVSTYSTETKFKREKQISGWLSCEWLELDKSMN